MGQQRTYRDLVNECDNFPYADAEDAQASTSKSYVKFKVDGCSAVLGYVKIEVAEKIAINHLWTWNNATSTLIFKPGLVPSDQQAAVRHRTKVFADFLNGLREAQTFKVLAGWRDELYPVYGPDRQLLFSMERSASALFGIVTYGVHMTAFTQESGGLKLWTPRRASTKQTYPNMMDNTVAGGLSTGERPFECMVRESMEEASLPAEVVSKAKCCGTMTYFYIRDERAGGEVGLCQPECQYVYDLELPPDVIPKPGDNEAVDFQLLSISEVQDALSSGKFKPNCALLIIEFFVRHGIITPENESDYLEIVARLHRRLEFPMGQVAT